jgi:hypothetical protein
VAMAMRSRVGRHGSRAAAVMQPGTVARGLGGHDLGIPTAQGGPSVPFLFLPDSGFGMNVKICVFVPDVWCMGRPWRHSPYQSPENNHERLDGGTPHPAA